MKKILIMISTGFIMLMISIVGIVAWFTYTKKTDIAGGNTTGLKYVYKINDVMSNPVTIHEVSVSFFDIENQSETKYLPEMSTKVSFELQNVGDLNLNYKIEFLDESDIRIGAIISNEESLTLDDTLIIKEQMEDSFEASINKGEKSVIYFYLFGIASSSSTNDEIYKKGLSLNFRITVSQ